MTPIPKLGELIKLDSIMKYIDPNDSFVKRDEIKELIGNHISANTTQYWLDILQPADVWCSEVLEWEQMLEHEGFKVIDMLQRIKRSDGLDIETLRCPIRFDDDIFKSEIAAPTIGQHTIDITKEFNL
jgi:crotonobetainyl-CoA:carnitine CoA-transferase CaiB-like acyl-CoA transferase